MISLTLTKSKLAQDFADLEITLLIFKYETPKSRESVAYTPEASTPEYALLNKEWFLNKNVQNAKKPLKKLWMNHQ